MSALLSASTIVHPRRVRVAQGVYQRINRRTGKPVEGKFEYTYRDATGRQVWQTAAGITRADAKAERAETVARMHRGERVERTNLTVGEVARLWLERGIGHRGPWSDSTRQRYEHVVRMCIGQSRDRSQRPLGERRLREVTIDMVATWSRANERAYAPTTALLALIALNQVFRFAARRGWVADNPVAKLEPAEKPRWRPMPVAILEPADLARVLAHTDSSFRPLFEFLAYTGLRIGEARGLCWSDVDFEAGLVRVHRQLDRAGIHRPLKTAAARREAILAPSVVGLLRERWLASPYKAADDLVFCNQHGRGWSTTHCQERFHVAVKRAGLKGQGRHSPHSLRHTYASLLIANGLDVVFVARQLGHANPAVTLSVYAHAFGRANHAEAAMEALEASYALMAGPAAR